MKKNNEKIRRVEEALIAAHRARGAAGPDDEFVRRVMLHIRRLGIEALGKPQKAIEQGLIWQFAAVTCAIALIFLVYTLSFDFSTIQYDAAQTVLGDPSGLMLVETIAVI